MQQLMLRRTDFRSEIERLYGDPHTSGWTELLLGGEPRWFLNIPNVFAVLAHPEGNHEFIQLPTRSEEHPGNAPAYWASLLYLLVYSFGWRSPAHGIQWWNDNRFPTDDARFALIKQVWVDDGMFEFFYEWLMTTAPRFDLDEEWANPRLEYSAYNGEPRYAINGKFPSMEGYHLPYGGGTDPLHLYTHVRHHNASPSIDGCTLTLAADGSPSGVLIADNWSSWWEYLRRSESLARPHSSGRSWRIEVFVRRFGHVGTFRRSRETGRWFAGKHRYHIVGNPSPQ